MKRFAFAIATAALLATPLAAQTQTSTVNLAGEVMKACVLGDPDVAQMNLGDLTDATGKLDASLVSAAISASASIPVAWCNAPSVITINATPMSLVTPPGYSTPAGFSRLITYTAAITGWDSALSDRPFIGDSAKSASALGAHAAEPLGIEVSLLSTLDAGGTVANSAFVEAGAYSSTIVIGLSVQP
jgi:hypothetical protein